MEKELNEINAKFQSGKHKEATSEIRTLIEKFPSDDQIYRAYDHLGDYLNFMGQHVQAVEAWTNALKLLEESPGGVDGLNEGKLINWLNISIGTARVTHRQGKEGSGVSHKYNTISYSSSKMSESEEAEWKKEQFQTAIKHYKGVIGRIPENNLDVKRNIRTDLAAVLFAVEEFDEAMQIYEDAFNNDGDVEWLYRAANCSWKQGKKEQAYVRLQQLIATEPTFAMAYKMCATYFTEKTDTVKADECTRQYRFYSWIPSFCQHIEYNPENVSLIEIIDSKKALKCVQTTLATDMSKRSSEFLAAICYHHYHGPVENKAFEELEKRGRTLEGDERDFVGSILMHLIRRHQSVCTVKGAASALAGMKYVGTFEVLQNLLPQDVRTFPMHIAMALAKLEDPRAIPLLIKMVEEPTKNENNDIDSSDGFFKSPRTSRLVAESFIALATFINDQKVKETLFNGTNKEGSRALCLAALGVSTGEKQYFDELEKTLAEGDTLDYTVVDYLSDHVAKSEQIDQILKLNEDIHKKKKEENNNDDK